MAREDDVAKLQQYCEALFQEVEGEAEATGTYKEDAFFSLSTGALIDEGVIPDAERVFYRREGKGRRSGIRVDGYTGDPLLYNETGESHGCVLSLIVCDFVQDEEVQTLNKTSMTADFKLVENYVRNSLDAKFRSGLESSDPAFDLAELIANRWDEVYRVKLYLITNRYLGRRPDKLETGEVEGREVVYDVWDLEALRQISAIGSEREPLVVNFSDYHAGPIRALLASDESAEEPVYLTAIPGEVLAQIYERWGVRLLEQNVRVFLSTRGNVNKGIKNTLENDPGHFFSFNNGITGTAEAIECSDGFDGLRIVSLTNFQIVNGGQTTASVHAALKRKVDLSKVYVQAKITIVRPEDVAELVPKISEYANSQNRVTASDFFANHPFHVAIENFSKSVTAPRKNGALLSTKWFYERMRGSYQNAQIYLTPAEKKKFRLEYPTKQKFVMTDLAKYLRVWTDQAYRVNLGAQKNMSEYAKVISKGWEEDPGQFDEYFFKELVAKKIIFNRTERIVSDSDWYTGGYRSQIVTLTIGLIWHEAHRRKKKVDFLKIWNDQAIDDLMKQAIELAATEVHNALMNPGARHGNFSEWAKKEACWDEIKALRPRWDRRWLATLIDEDAVPEGRVSGQHPAEPIDPNERRQLVRDADSGFWLDVYEWLIPRQDLTDATEQDTLFDAYLLGDDKDLSEEQVRVLSTMMERLEQQGCPHRLREAPTRAGTPAADRPAPKPTSSGGKDKPANERKPISPAQPHRETTPTKAPTIEPTVSEQARTPDSPPRATPSPTPRPSSPSTAATVAPRQIWTSPGHHPGFPGTGGRKPAKTSYYRPPAQVKTPPNPTPLETPAEELISQMPVMADADSLCRQWEKAVLDAYYHLYGDEWVHWRRILPWLTKPQLKARVKELGCEDKWDWTRKTNFIKTSGMRWSVDDMDYLIDWYPERQNDATRQTFYMPSNKSFAEIQKLARVLGVPSRSDITKLANYTLGLR